MAHRVLGMGRDKLGLGIPTAGPVLTSITLAAAFGLPATDAQAACVLTTAPDQYTCSGAETTRQTLFAADNATITTAPGYSATSSSPAGPTLFLWGAGSKTYIDENASVISSTAPNQSALTIVLGEDLPGNPASLFLRSNGDFTANGTAVSIAGLGGTPESGYLDAIFTGTLHSTGGNGLSYFTPGQGASVTVNNAYGGYSGVSFSMGGGGATEATPTGDSVLNTTGLVRGLSNIYDLESYGISLADWRSAGTGNVIVNVLDGSIVEGYTAAIRAWGDAGASVGAEAFINNDGLIRNLTAASDDLVISGQDIGLTITNRGLAVGTVELSRFDDSFANSGTWNTAGGTSDFGDGVNSVMNTGTILASTAGASAPVTTTFNQVGTFTNAGIVQMQNGVTGDRTVVGGNYVGAGGTIVFDTYLGDDSSATDLLVINGDTSGSSNVRVVNVGGAGAQTVEGIRIIDVGGASNGTFVLVDGDDTIDGEEVVVAGAYAYRLLKNGVSTPSDGDWYLRSTLTPTEPTDPTEPTEPTTPTEPTVPTEPTEPTDPTEPTEPTSPTSPTDPTDPTEPTFPTVPTEPTEPTVPSEPLYQGGAPVYEAYPQVLLALNGLPTLQQRVGNRYWRMMREPEPVFCKDGSQNFKCAPTSAQEGYYADGSRPVIEGGAVWGRIEGAHRSIEPDVSTTRTDYDVDLFKLQAGLDFQLHEAADGSMLIGGVTVHYGHASADVSSRFGTGKISTDGYGFGGTLTWYGANGFYVDGQAQVSWYDSDLSAHSRLGSLVEGNDGFGYALSLEAGKRIELDNGWTLTPQAQLVYSAVDFDGFTQVTRTGRRIDVSLDDGESLRGRLGLSLDRQSSWQAEDGTLSRTHIYGIANLTYEFLDGTVMDVGGTKLVSRTQALWGGIGLGGSYNWSDDRYSLYGEGSIDTSLDDFGDSYELKGTVGLRLKW